jgi:hypothetical protein
MYVRINIAVKKTANNGAASNVMYWPKKNRNFNELDENSISVKKNIFYDIPQFDFKAHLVLFE